MFYEAVAADTRRSIGMAVSGDGRGGWRRLGRPILEAGPAGAWDSGGVGAPCPVSMAGRGPHCEVVTLCAVALFLPAHAPQAPLQVLLC